MCNTNAYFFSGMSLVLLANLNGCISLFGNISSMVVGNSITGHVFFLSYLIVLNSFILSFNFPSSNVALIIILFALRHNNLYSFNCSKYSTSIASIARSSNFVGFFIGIALCIQIFALVLHSNICTCAKLGTSPFLNAYGFLSAAFVGNLFFK